MSKQITSAQQAVDAQTITLRDVKFATWICFFAWTFAVYDFVLFGNLLPVLAKALGWSDARSTAVNTWVTVGTAIVAFGIGPLIDRIGRRRGIILAVFGAGLGSLLTAAAGWVAGVTAGVGLVLLVLVRSAAGLGYAEQAANATYLNELFAETHADPARSRKRGRTYSLVQSGWPVGSVLAAGSIYLLYPVGGWALCFAIAIIPSAAVAIAARSLKESPRFAGLRAARVRAGQHAPLWNVLRGDSRRATLTIGTAFLLSWLGILTFSILGTSLLTAPSGKAIDFSNALAILAVSNVTAFSGYLFHGWLGDRIGRRNTIAAGWLVSALAFGGMLLAPRGQVVPVVTLYSAGLFFLIGPFAALVFFITESFPTSTRGTGSSIINAAGQVGAVIGGFIITAALGAHQSWTHVAMVCGCLPVLAAAATILGARNIDPGSVRDD